MTTTTSSTRIRHDSDATYREWVQEMTTKLAACGLVQTADTGQIDPATVVRPGTNASGGYQIWRFDDAMQATAPVFMRIEYRTGSAVTTPAMFIGVGTSTNGAGTLGGVTHAPVAMASMNAAQITDTLRNSYWCHTAGSFAMNWKVGASTTETVIVVCRTVSPTTGVANGDGLLSLRISSNYLSVHVLKFTATTSVVTTTNAESAQLCHWPFIQTTSSLVGLDPQVGLAFIPVNRVTPVVGVVGVRDSEFAAPNTFTFTPVGSTAHTYLACTNFPHMSAGSYLKPAILWE